MKKTQRFYIIILILLCVLTFIFAYYNWWFFTGIFTLITVTSLINCYDVYCNNKIYEKRNISNMHTPKIHTNLVSSIELVEEDNQNY